MSPDLSILSRKPNGSDVAAIGRPGSVQQIPLPRRKWLTSIGVPGALVLGAFGLVLYASADAWRPAHGVHVVPVIVRTGSGAGQGNAIVQAPGWVEADPFPTAVSALTDGIVSEVLVLEGEAIKANQVVARLVRTDAELALQRATAEVAEKQAALDLNEATLNAAQRSWDNPVEVKRQVAAAEAMLAERKAELDRWPSEVAATQARDDELESERERLEKLRQQEQAGEIEYIRARRQAEAQHAVLQSTIARKPVLEAQIAAGKAELDAARENLRLRIPEKRALDEARANVALAKAMLERIRAMEREAKLRLERTEVRSPSDGVVMTRLARPGSKMMMNSDNADSTHIVHLYDPAHLQVRVDIPLGDAAKVGVGQEAEIVVNILPDRVFRGRVTRIVNEADVQKNTLQVKVAIDNPSPQLKPEMLARVRFFGGNTATSQPDAQATYTMSSVIQHHPGGHTYVWLVDRAKSVARERSVSLGSGRVDEWIEVTDGLSAGDQLIADPPAGLEDGQKVSLLGEMPQSQHSAGGEHGAH